MHSHVTHKRVISDDDDCFYYHSWRNNVVIAFGTLSSFECDKAQGRVHIWGGCD